MSRKKAKREYQKIASQGKSFDAIIIPGIAFNERNTKKWSTTMRYRVIWSWILYKNGIAKNIIYSGGAVYTPFYEAYAMGQYAIKLGIPAENIFYDTLAKHTIGNVYYSYLIAQEQNFEALALTTDRFQSTFIKRSLRRRFASRIFRLPVIKDSVDHYNFLQPEIDVDLALVSDPVNFRSIRESETVFQRLKGTLGRNIPWKKYKNGKLPPLQHHTDLLVEHQQVRTVD